MSWFTVKVRYTKQNEDGSFKRVTEPYLLAAVSFTDAEKRIYEELENTIRGEFRVMSINIT
jgi:DNA replication initiation complex subunit (GINS family)